MKKSAWLWCACIKKMRPGSVCKRALAEEHLTFEVDVEIVQTGETRELKWGTAIVAELSASQSHFTGRVDKIMPSIAVTLRINTALDTLHANANWGIQ